MQFQTSLSEARRKEGNRFWFSIFATFYHATRDLVGHKNTQRWIAAKL